MTTEIIRKNDIREYFFYLLNEILSIQRRLLSGEASKEEIQAFIDWRNHETK